MKLIRDYEAACHDLAVDGANSKLLEKVSALQHELEISGGWEIETNARNVLTRLGITDTSAKMKTLSGGQRKRVALAHELIFKPDILILDEPTNHLDADTIEWLEEYLARYTGTLLLVTHDRYFLDRVTNRIFEIDRGAVQPFGGNYAYYLEKKEEQETLRAVEGHKREQLIKKELAWLRRGAKARTTQIETPHRCRIRFDGAAEGKGESRNRYCHRLETSGRENCRDEQRIEILRRANIDRRFYISAQTRRPHRHYRRKRCGKDDSARNYHEPHQA